jgi:hypothetical protein
MLNTITILPPRDRRTQSRPSSRGDGGMADAEALRRSQLNLAAALLDASAKGNRLTENQKAEVRSSAETIAHLATRLALCSRLLTRVHYLPHLRAAESNDGALW